MPYTPYTASTLLYSGNGYIYFTDATGNLAYHPGLNTTMVGIPNTEGSRGAVLRIGNQNSPSAGATFANAFFEITSAAAGNLTVLNINGVPQIGAAVAMVPGDIPASVAAVVAQVNAYNAPSPNNWTATNFNDVVLLIPEVAGSQYNGQAVAFTFTGLSTATKIDAGGGVSSNERTYRIWLNPDPVTVDMSDPVAVAANFAAAIEVTDYVGIRGAESPTPSLEVAVSANTVVFTRTAALMNVAIDGVTTIGAANEVSTFLVIGAQANDEVVLSGKDGAVSPLLLASAFGYLELDKLLVGYDTTVRLRYTAAGDWAQTTPNAMSGEALRALGFAVPAQPGVYQLAPVAGTFTIRPGQTGVSGATVYEHNIGLKAPGLSPLPAALNFTFNAATAIPGDTGVISGNGISIGLFGQAVNFTDSLGNILASLTDEMALSGLWTATWTYIGLVAGVATFNWSLLPDFSPANTQFIDPTWLIDNSIPDSKIINLDGAKIDADSIPQSALSPLVQAKLDAQGRTTVTTTILTASVLTLNTVPVLAVAAPGAGYMIKVESVQAGITYTAPVYATNTTLQLIFSGASVSVAESATFLVKTTNAIITVPFNTTVAAGQTQLLENTALYWKVATGDPTAGASDITLYVTYSIMAV